MKDTIYLICTKSGIDRMRKSKQSATDLRQGEIPVKLSVEVDDTNWKPPYIEKKIFVNRWDKDIDVEDIHFEKHYVTEEEAEEIRNMRLKKMREILKEQGYRVERIEDDDEDRLRDV